MGDAGSAGAQFDRAIKARNVIAALDAARPDSLAEPGHALELLSSSREGPGPVPAGRQTGGSSGFSASAIWSSERFSLRLPRSPRSTAVVGSVVPVLRELVNRPRLANERRREPKVQTKRRVVSG